ncbi:MAG TPA: surface layer protein [Bacteroidia bacterium]|nr:surface layer protein [Bacteroidia bacterium]HNU32831.1 surface layer protein [Bacteroidia bacterium]
MQYLIKKWLLLIAFCIITACRKDKPEDVLTPSINTAANGVYITNEGNFQFGNAQVSYYDPSSNNCVQDLFAPANNRPLGDVCQSMHRFNGKIYMVVNNSGKIEVVNESNFASVATITGLTSPRYFLPVSNSKAYVTDLYADYVSIIDLSNNAILGTISCSGQTEEMALSYGKVFVTNYLSDKLYVINTLTDVLTDSIAIGIGSNSIVEDKNGKLWVLCSGSISNAVNASLHRINPLNNSVELSFTFSNPTETPWRLNMNSGNDTLYYLNNDLYRMSITALSLPPAPFISHGTKNFYGLGINPSSNEIYVSDAIDYVQRGKIYRYDAAGTQLNTFLAGIIPGNFYFK